MAPSCFPMSADMDWLWGTLKPWQILHSTLAERERCGSTVMDVWELVNETILSSRTLTSEETTRVKDHPEGINGSRTEEGMQLIMGDDLEYWKHGGVMEARVKEWLAMREYEEETADYHHHEPNIIPHLPPPHGNRLITRSINRELAIFQPNSILSVPGEYNIHVAAEFQASSYDQLYDSVAGENDAEEGGGGEEEEEEEEENPDQMHIEMDRTNYSTEEEEEEEELEASGDGSTVLSCTSTSHETGIGGEEGGGSQLIVVVNQCCSSLQYGTAAGGYWSSTAKLAEATGWPDLEKGGQNSDIGVICAVCLEPLDNYDTVGNGDDGRSVQPVELACRHAFHRGCISPWLQHQLPHACCPCCRAPITTTPPDLAAPPTYPHPMIPPNPEAPLIITPQHHYTCADHAHDIMGLLADVEAALERLGFRS